MIGNDPSIGAWNTDRAFMMETDATNYPKWFSHSSIYVSTHVIEYKYLILGNGETKWESGENRRVNITGYKIGDN